MQRTKCPVVPIEQARAHRERKAREEAIKQILDRASKTDW